MAEKINIVTKEVRNLNQSNGYISMPRDSIGKEFVVMTQEELEFLLGRKLENKEWKQKQG